MKNEYFVLLAWIAITALTTACSEPTQSPAKPPAALVSLASATIGPATETLTVYGDVSADLSGQRDLVAPVEALIESIEAPLGTSVLADDVVAMLSPSPSTTVAIAQAAASANQADSAYERTQRLRADGLVSDAEVETARAAAESADSALASLRGRGLVLKSPIEGTVTSIGFASGALVTAGATVAVVTVDGDVRARFGIDPALARRVTPGDPIRISPTSGGAALSQSVVAIDPVGDPVTRLASIFTIIPAAAEIAPGEPLRGEIEISRSEHAVTIPYSAVLNDGGQAFVYTVSSGIAHRTDITLGGRNGDRIAVMSGVTEGDEVVTQGAAGLSDGLAVHGKKEEGNTNPSLPSATPVSSAAPPEADSDKLPSAQTR